MIVVDRAGRVEITGRVQPGIVVLGVRGAVAAESGTGVIRHVVDHRVRDDPDAHGFAPIHHIREFGAGPGAAVGDAITHRLIAFAPGVRRFDAVFLGRRDLYGREARRAEHVFTLGRDVGPAPFEEVDEYVAGGHVPGRTVGLREHGPLRSRSSQLPGTARRREHQQHRGGGGGSRRQ